MTLTVQSAYQLWLEAGAPQTNCIAQEPTLDCFIDELWSHYDHHVCDICDIALRDTIVFDLFTVPQFNALMIELDETPAYQ